MATPAQLFRLAKMGSKKRTLLKAGLIDENGVHTQEGRNLLWNILFEEFEDALVESAEAYLNEKEKAAKKSKEA